MKFLIFIFILLCIGCNDVPDVEHYKAPKTHHGENAQVEKPKEQYQAGNIHWNTPSNWQESAGSGMRMASFKKEGTDLDVSIVKLMGNAGGFVSNINRWRGQINLKDQTEKEVMKSLIQEKSSLSPFVWVKMENEGKGILAAIYKYEDVTLFVKATGEIKTINNEKDNFISLCKSLHSDVQGHNHEGEKY